VTRAGGAAGTVWTGALLVYRCLDVRLPDGRRFRHTLSEDEVGWGVEAFRGVPALVERLSAGEARFSAEVVALDRCLESLTAMGEGLYWPSPSDTRAQLDRLVPPGSRDSVFVLWPQQDLRRGEPIPSGGWGLAIGATDWSNGATYATVANAPRAVWAEPVPGEVWLHEWLHGVCDHYARRGFPMPPGDADGGARGGYRREPDCGWSRYYADLMTGQVAVDGRHLGISAAAWRTGSITGR
jgi:hypothetical protein